MDFCIPDHSSLSPGKHTAPVWQIKWIEKERGSGDETAEVLVSISTDGRVCQWSIRKGFECYGMLMSADVWFFFNSAIYVCCAKQIIYRVC